MDHNYGMFFNEKYYLEQNPDVAGAVAAGVFTSGLAHFEKFGKSEGRIASKFLDLEVYKKANPDLADAGLTSNEALRYHFYEYGMREGRTAVNPEIFDLGVYKSSNADLVDAGLSDNQIIHHFYQYGYSEGRTANANYDPTAYVNNYNDLQNQLGKPGGINGFGQDKINESGWYHYLNYGIYEGRSMPLKGVTETEITVTVSESNALTVEEGKEVLYSIELTKTFSEEKSYFYNITGDKLGGTVNAASANDFAQTNGKVVFQSNRKIATLALSPLADSFVEGKEGFKITISDSSGKVVASRTDILFDGPIPSTTPQDDPPGDTTPPTASLFKVTGTTVGATSNEAGKIALYNGAAELAGLSATLTSPGGLTQTITVAAQAAATSATLKILDSAGNVATQTQSVVLGTTGNDGALTGTGASDWMFGFAGDDTISGAAGDDYIVGGQGSDTMDGGGGIDTLSYNDVAAATAHGLANIAGMAINLSGGVVTAAVIATAMGGTIVIGGGAGGAGSDLAAGTVGYLATNAGGSTVTMVRDTISNFENVVGSELGDYIMASTADNVITGGAGADYIDLVSGADDVIINSPATEDRIINFYFGNNFISAPVNDQIVFDTAAFTGANLLNRVNSSGAVVSISATPTSGTLGNVILTSVDLTDNVASTALPASDLLLIGGAAGGYSASTDTVAEIQTLLQGGTETITLTNSTDFVGSFLIAYLAGNGITPADLKLALVTSDGTGNTTASANASVTVTDIATISGISTIVELNGVAAGIATGSDFYFI